MLLDMKQLMQIFTKLCKYDFLYIFIYLGLSKRNVLLLSFQNVDKILKFNIANRNGIFFAIH